MLTTSRTWKSILRPSRAIEKKRYLRIPVDKESEHISILGDTGTGKTQVIHQFLGQIAEREEAAIIYDPACEFLEAHYDASRGDLILNPLDARSPYWTPSFECGTKTDYELIAESFFPGKADESSTTRFFLEGKRAVFARMLEFHPSVDQLVEWLQDATTIDGLIQGTELAHTLDKKAPGQRGGVLGDLGLIGKTLRLLPRQQDCATDICLSHWAQTRKGWIFITSTQDTRKQLRPLHAAFIDILMKKLMAVDRRWGKKHPCWIITDETHALERLSALENLLAEGRKYGLKNVLGNQNRVDLEVHYGKMASKMLSAPALKIAFRHNEPGSAEWVSKLIGETETEKPRIGTTASPESGGRDSMNYSRNIERKAVISKEQIMALPDLHAYWKYEDIVVPFRIEYVDHPQRITGFVPRVEQVSVKGDLDAVFEAIEAIKEKEAKEAEAKEGEAKEDKGQKKRKPKKGSGAGETETKPESEGGTGTISEQDQTGPELEIVEQSETSVEESAEKQRRDISDDGEDHTLNPVM